MSNFIPLEKMSKKARREYYAQKRGSWNGVHPVTQIAPNKKAAARKMRTRKKDVASFGRDATSFPLHQAFLSGQEKSYRMDPWVFPPAFVVFRLGKIVPLCIFHLFYKFIRGGNTMKQLINTLNEASAAYYKGTPIMTDHDWDVLFEKLKQREREAGFALPDSPTRNVGAGVVSSLKKVHHEYPALSLDKTKNVEELTAFFKQGERESNRCEEIIMWKMDGSTVQLTYEDGKLKCAATRGNGEIGSDITHNAPLITGIPLSIDYTGKLVLRGEAVMSYSDFKTINKQLGDENAYQNPRNLAAASIMLLDSNELKLRKVNFFAFNLVYCADMPQLFDERLAMLKNLGFQIVPHEITNADLLKEKLDRWERKVPSFDYPVDGLVIALNNATWADTLPGTDHNPHKYRGFALKWADECVETVLRDIEWSASRTGLLNPVAIFDPIQLEGTTVKKASLHNVSYILQKDLKMGDRITVFKANKIIPQIAANLDQSTERNRIDENIPIKKYAIPEYCPICGHKTTLTPNPFQGNRLYCSNDETVKLQCDNPNCSAKQVGKFVHFCERDCMNLEGWSKKTIEMFVERGYITEYADFWHLDRFRDKIVQMDGFGDRSYQKLIDAAQKARTTSFIPFIHALSIPNIGRGQAKLIYQYFFDKMQPDETVFDLFTQALEDGFDFTAIDGIGPVLNDSLNLWAKNNLDWTSDTEMGRLLEEIQIVQESKPDTKNQPEKEEILGKVFVITGKVFHFKNRAELKDVIERCGGKVTGSVTSKTDYLINNDIKSTSGKNKKAKELNVPILSEADFLEMIN